MFTSVTLLGRLLVDSGGRLGPALHFSSATMLRGQESTLNREEVDKFKAMASTWWDPSGPCRPLHSMNTLRIPFIRDGLLQSGLCSPDLEDTAAPLTGLRILDVGCGAGIVSEQLARIGARVVGLDACKENIEAAEAHAALDPGLADRLSYQCSTVEEHASGVEEPYDCVVASEVLEHVDCQEVFLRKCTGVLRPNGSIFVTTINRNTRSWLLAIVGAEYVVGLLPRGTHQWEKFVQPEESSAMLTLGGCTTRSVQGMMYLPWSNSWSWTSDCSVNYALHAVKM